MGQGTLQRTCHLQHTYTAPIGRSLYHRSSFCIVGVQKAPWGAKAYVIRETLLSAANEGILSIAHSAGLWPKSVLEEKGILPRLPKMCSMCAAPSAVHLLKGRLDESVIDWRFRLAVTHAGQPLCRISRQIKRCLTQPLKELHIACPFWGSPSMLNVKDMWTHSSAPWDAVLQGMVWNP